MCCVAGASVAIGHLEVNVHFSQERSHLNGETWDEFQLFLDDVSQHVQLLRFGVMLCQIYMHSFWISERLPNGSKYTPRLEKTRVVFVVYLLGTICSLTDSIILVDVVFALGRSCSFEQFH